MTEPVPPRGRSGAIDTPPLAELFAENFALFGEAGAAVSVWRHGEEIVSLAAGGFQDSHRTMPWTADTPVLFWSATKGLAVSALLHACERHSIPLETPVSALWPEFAAEGKAKITVEELLSHRAGLAALDRPAPVEDYAQVVQILAAQPPNWPLGAGHGYHPRTFGYLLDELVRRITNGMPLGEYWRLHFAEPLALDLWMGVPADRADEVAAILPPTGSVSAKGDPFLTAFLTPNSLTSRAFASPRGLHSAASMNAPSVRAASYPAFGGIGTARSLAKFYSMLATGGRVDGVEYFTAPALAAMSRLHTQGFDQVLQMETAFSTGFMKDPLAPDGAKLRRVFGPSPSAFGHPGAGGSHAFADPEHGLSFAYVMSRMEPGVLPNPKSLRLVEALYSGMP